MSLQLLIVRRRAVACAAVALAVAAAVAVGAVEGPACDVEPALAEEAGVGADQPVVESAEAEDGFAFVAAAEPAGVADGLAAESAVGSADLAAANGWAIGSDGSRHWYDDGVMAADKAFYDPGTGAWYWADADGSIACDKDVFIPVSNEDRTSGKWVRFDEQSRMVKGEDCRYGGWYYFDEVTGEMAKGVRLVEGGDGWKWVYYDVITGQMAHGEAFLSYDADHNGWYYFDDASGAMAHGFAYISDQQKWAFYDEATGVMAYGERFVGGAWYLLDGATGEVRYGWQRLSDGRIVHYDGTTGRMDHGEATFAGRTYNLDEATGALRQDQADAFTLAVPEHTLANTSLASQLASGSVRSVRLFGDSVMAGVGASGCEGISSNLILFYHGMTYYEPLATVDCAGNSLRASVEAYGAAFVNDSIPGKGSMKLFSQVSDEQLGSEDFAIVILGTNDRGAFDSSETLDEYVSASYTFLSRLSELYGGNIVVLSSAPAKTESYNFTLREADEALGNLCRSQGWSFGSLYQAFEALREAEGFDAACLYADDTHPNDRGQELLWEAMAQVLRL